MAEAEARTPRSRALATWLAIAGGAFGLHRFYLHGWRDAIGWLHWPPTLLGLYGVARVRRYGHDDLAAWPLMPLFGFSVAAAMASAIACGLASDERWRARYGGAPGAGSGIAVTGAVVALAVGAGALIATIAYTAQRWFEYAALGS